MARFISATAPRRPTTDPAPRRIYLHPSGYKVRMAKHHAAPSWRLVGTVPDGAFCHRPCTVSGGGKSEISKATTTWRWCRRS